MSKDNLLFSSHPAEELKSFLSSKGHSKVVVLADENTRRFCYPAIAPGLPEHTIITVPGGEEHKILSTCVVIWNRMTEINLDRHSVMIVLGGGVLGDMGGFCAATYKRGIDFILVPTTLLALVDASIGGKLGIDFNNFKNHIGVFQLPVLTLLHSGFLKTLPESEIRSGYAEVVKHILTSDAAMWQAITTQSLQSQNWEELIQHSVSFKASVVTKDPREVGFRKILNAGHTIGHALESYYIAKGQRILHGEAIAAGLVAESYIAMQKGMLAEAELTAVMGYIRTIFGKINLQASHIEAICELVRQDKKNKGNKILCVLLKGIGSAEWDVEISLDNVKEALSFYETQM
jgi:3-dehydroquinate synthase